MSWFLKAKHWQLFLFIYGLPFIFIILAYGTFFATLIGSGAEIENFDFGSMIVPFFGFFLIAFAFGLVSIVMYKMWQWKVAVNLHKSLEPELRMNLGTFKFFYVVPFILMFVFPFLSYSMILVASDSYPVFSIILFSIYLLSIIFAIFSEFYLYYFISRALKTFELKKEVTFSDYVGEFFLVWFLFVGLWILQPKLNNMSFGKTNFELE